MTVSKEYPVCGSLIAGLTLDYDAVFLIHTATSLVDVLRFDEANTIAYGNSAQFHTVGDVLDCIARTAHPDDFTVIENVMLAPLTALGSSEARYFDYRSARDGDYKYFRFKVIKLDADGKEVLWGFSDVDESVREEKIGREELNRLVAEQAELIGKGNARYDTIQKDIVEGMATLVESRDLKTGQHVEHTRQYVSIILNKLLADGLFPETVTPRYVEDVCLASVLHDIGKIFISDVLLNKPGKLSPEEFEIIKSHPVLGAEIVDRVFAQRLNPQVHQAVRDIVLGHHEKWNGTGYPNHISGDDIPLSARVMAVADVFDALISKRAYKESFSLDSAFDILIKDSGTHFDKRIVDAFVAEREVIEDYLNSQSAESVSDSTSLFKEFGDFERKLQQDSITRSLTEDYELVLYAEPDLDRITVVRQSDISKSHVDYASEYHLSFSRFTELATPFIHPEDCEQFVRELSKDHIRVPFGSSAARFYTFRRIAADGNYKWYQMKLYRLGKTEDSNFDVLVGINDVNDLEIAKQKEKEALAEAKQRAEQANQAKSDFVYRISHDIRTPFSDIVSLTDLALMRADDPAAMLEYLKKIKNSEEHLLEAMNGILAIETMEGGSKSENNTTVEDTKDAEDESFDDTEGLAGKRLLLVEDNELNREIGVSILEECGALMESADDGSVAVEMVKSHPAGYYDAILMDLQMEIMGGIEATAIIRALPDKAVANVPIIAMTANAFERDKIAVREAGMNAYLTKPIDVPALIATLHPLLKKK